MENIYSKAAKIIYNSKSMVFFGGAGVSTECGIPDFRSKDGLYNMKSAFNYSPEVILSHSFFKKHPEIFYDFIRDNILKYDVSPNKGHLALAELEKAGVLDAVVTQNIDGLHQAAGSMNVLELHGSMSRFYCSRCFTEYASDFIKRSESVPLCTCGGVIRPDIVLYEEELDENVVLKTVNHIKKADTLLVAGTSLVVYPAAGLLRYFSGENLIIINMDNTSYDSSANLVIHEPFALTMEKIMNQLEF